MPETPDTPAVRAREAEQAARVELWRQVMTMGKHCDMPDGPMADALDAYRDAVAARVTAELLGSGVRVELERDFPGARLSVSAPVRDMERWYLGMLTVEGSALEPLTPPGTVHQAVLLMKPEEPNG